MARDNLDTQENREEFARRLAEERVRKGWNQSELARQAALYTATKKFGRDLVSSYEKGKMFPTGVNLNALARALHVAPESLMPGGASRAPTPEPALSFRETSDGRMWLRVNQAVDFDVGLQVVALLRGKKISALPDDK